MSDTVRRSDAEANRARIVAVARELLAESGSAGPGADELRLNAVAKRAGVGQGTLYRHFPTREHLLAEVYRQDVDELVAAAPELLTEHPPLDALARWLDRVVAHAQVKRGVLAAVEASVWTDLSAHSQGPIGDALTGLLEAGRRDGTVRADADARDVVLLLGALTRLDAAEWDARARSLVSLIHAGLRAY